MTFIVEAIGWGCFRKEEHVLEMGLFLRPLLQSMQGANFRNDVNY